MKQTGEGGRELNGTKAKPKNLRTAPQSKNQTLTRGNLALSLNVTSKEPVRVIRGYKLPTKFAPEYGYRYDGLYSVEKFWDCIGLAGFKVYKFALRRLPDQAPPPWAHISPSAQVTFKLSAFYFLVLISHFKTMDCRSKLQKPVKKEAMVMVKMRTLPLENQCSLSCLTKKNKMKIFKFLIYNFVYFIRAISSINSYSYI